MNKDNNQSKPLKSRLLRLLAYAVTVCLGILVLFIIVFGRQMAREGLFNIPAPSTRYSTEKLFVMAPASNDASTSGSRAAEQTSGTLPRSYAPFIPDAPDLPKGLREQRGALNRQFEDVMRRVEDYEKRKLRMSFKETSQFFLDIGRAFGSIQIKIEEEKTSAHHNRQHFDSSAIDTRTLSFQYWYSQSQFEAYSRLKHWGAAEGAADSIYYLNRALWQAEQRGRLMRQGMLQPFVSSLEYDRATGYVDQQRSNWCRLKQGPIGYIPITTHFIKKRVYDLMDRYEADKERERLKHITRVPPRPR